MNKFHYCIKEVHGVEYTTTVKKHWYLSEKLGESYIVACHHREFGIELEYMELWFMMTYKGDGKGYFTIEDYNSREILKVETNETDFNKIFTGVNSVFIEICNRNMTQKDYSEGLIHKIAEELIQQCI